MAKIKYCTFHKIGYNPELDPNCPQCMVGQLHPQPAQVDFDTETQKPIDADKV